MIGGVGGTPPFRPYGSAGSSRATDAAAAAARQAAREAEARAESARALAPLLALLEAAARREDVVDLLGPSPAAALLDGLADKARAVADLALQSIPSPTPLVVQATAARLPQAVASLLADRIYEAAVAPLPASLDTSVRVLSAGSPLVAAYLERAARYLLVSRLLAAGRSDLDALVAAIKHAATTAATLAEDQTATAEGTSSSNEGAGAPLLRLLADGRESERVGGRARAAAQVRSPEIALTVSLVVPESDDRPTVDATDPVLQGVPESEGGGVAPRATVPVADATIGAISLDAAEVVEQLADLLPADAAVDVAFDIDGEPTQLEADDPASSRPRTSWRALPQLVTASYHIVPVAVALEQLRDGAQWIASPAFPADADVVLGDQAASLSSSDRMELRELGDRTALVTPSLTRAVAALRLPAPWSEELLAGLAPPASRAPDARMREQVRVLCAVTMLREAEVASRRAATGNALPDAPPVATMRRASTVLGELAARPLPPDVRALLEAMAVDPAMRPTISRAVRYVLASRELARLRTGNADTLTLEHEPLPATLDALLGEDLPAIGPIGREMLRALAAGAIEFAPVPPPAGRRRGRGRQTHDASSGGANEESGVAPNADDAQDRFVEHGEAFLLSLPPGNRRDGTGREPPAMTGMPSTRWPELVAVALVILLWLLLR